MPTFLHNLTHSAILRITPQGAGEVQLTVIEKNFRGTPQEEFSEIESLGELALSKLFGLRYRPAFRRLTLSQHGAEALQKELLVRVSQSWGSDSGFVNMSGTDSTAEIISEEEF